MRVIVLSVVDVCVQRAIGLEEELLRHRGVAVAGGVC